MNKIYFVFLELTIIFSFILVPLEIKKSNQVSEYMSYTIVIDPGHGGKDNGCFYDEIYEDNLNLQISEKLCEQLINQGFVVYLTRNGDYDLSQVNSINHKNDDLKNRARLINSYHADILVSIHMNFYQDESVNGPMVYYRGEDDESNILAKKIQDNLNNLTNLNKVVHEGDFYLFSHTRCLAILVECGFLSNSQDRNNLNNSNYQTLLANEIFQGIINYINNNYDN